MTREEILKLARRAGWSGIYTKPLLKIAMKEQDFLYFAFLVAAAGREKFAAMENDQNESDLLTIAYVSGFEAGKKKRKLKPLTDEEIDALDEANWDTDHKVWGIREFARSIERAHGIGEKI